MAYLEQKLNKLHPVVFISAKSEWKCWHGETVEALHTALHVQKPSNISVQSLMSTLINVLFIQETRVRLERREIRERWGRMDLQDFQVSISTANNGRTETKGHAIILYLFQPCKSDDLKLTEFDLNSILLTQILEWILLYSVWSKKKNIQKQREMDLQTSSVKEIPEIIESFPKAHKEER